RAAPRTPSGGSRPWAGSAARCASGAAWEERRYRRAARGCRRGASGVPAVARLRVAERRHHFLGEQPEAREHALLRDYLHAVQKEVYPVHAPRLPLLHGADDALGIAEPEPLARLLVGASVPVRRG